MQTADVLVWGPLVASILFVVVRMFTMRSLKFKLSDPMGPVNWSFADSWASTLTGVGALGTILAATAVLPEKTQILTTAESTGLSLLFGVLIPIAPLVYNATRQHVKVVSEPGKEQEDLQYQGKVWSFVLACAITLWAVVGELTVVFLLVGESSMSALASLVFQVFLLGACFSMFVYAWHTIYWTVKFPIDRREAYRKEHPGEEVPELSLPQWAVL